MPNAGCVAADGAGEVVVLTSDTANQTSTTVGIISPVLTQPANKSKIGTTFYFRVALSCAAGATAQTTPGIVYSLRWGGVAGVVIASVGVITPATSLAAAPGEIWGAMTVRGLGSGTSGLIKGWIGVIDPRIVREATTAAVYAKIGKTGVTAAGVDTTTSKDVCVTSICTVADASAITFGESGFMAMVQI